MARSGYGIKAQHGTQSAVGTPVAAPTPFSNMTVSVEPEIQTDSFRQGGARARTSTWVTLDASKGKGDGIPDYLALLDILGWAYGAGTVAGDVTSWETPGAPAYRTIEVGDAVDGVQVRDCYVTGWDLEWGAIKGDAKFGIEFEGGKYDDGKTLTTAAAAPVPVPLLAQHVSVYCDDTYATLGTTKVSGVLSGKVKVAKLRDGVRYLDASKAGGLSDTVEAVPDVSIELLIEGSAGGLGWLTTLRAGATKYLRIEATGGEYSAVLDFCVQTDKHGRGEQDGIYTVTATLVAAEDASGFWHGASISLPAGD